jgi:dTDP-4-amino-4,6-dideoxygalactose transaminase
MTEFFKPDLTAPRYLRAIKKQLILGRVGPGEANEAFAAAIKDYTKANYVLLTTSGTVALQLVLSLFHELKIGVPAYGEVATANAVTMARHMPVPLEIDRATGCLHVAHTLSAINAGTVHGIVFVNFSGNTPGFEIATIYNRCDSYNLPFIEDAACGLGHWDNGKHAGTFGRFGTLSFSPHKLVTTGQGGAILIRDEIDYVRLKAIINQGNKGQTTGGNFRMSDINAALGLAQMNVLDKLIETRQRQIDKLLLQKHNLWLPESGPPVHNIIFDGAGEKNYSLLCEHRNYEKHKRVIDNYQNAKWWAANARYLPFGLGQSI